MAENIAKIDEKIRELKRKKKAVENREKIKDQCEAIKAINQSLKNSKLKIEKITEIVGFLQEQESFDDRFSIFVPGNPFSPMFSEADLF